MNDNLEKFILENRGEFDSHEPDPKIWNGIINAKEDIHQIGWHTWKKNLLRVAAVFAIAVVSVFLYEKFIDEEDIVLTSDNVQPIEVDPEIQELIEAEVYYGNEVNNKMSELKKYKDEYEDIKEDLYVDFEELDSAYTDLKNELEGEIFSEEVVESMIQNYRIKLEILQDLIDQIKRSRQMNEAKKNKNKTDNYEI